MPDNEQFELQVFLKDHWVTEDFCGSEREAQAAAKDLLGSSGFGGVRILKAKQRGGQETERVIFTQMKPQMVRDDQIRASPIEDAPACDSVGDLFRPESRQTIGKVIRQYLEKFVLTPTELLHNHREMKRALDFESLAPSAVSRVAAVQTGSKGAEASKRNAALYDLINACSEKLRKASAVPDLPVLKGSTLSSVMRQLDSRVKPEDQEYFATLVLCKELVSLRTWLGKLETLVGLVGQEQDPRAKSLADGVIADIFGSADALRDVLGRQPDLGTALLRAFDLAEGKAEKDDAMPEVTVNLASQINDNALAGAKLSLYQAIGRQLKGSAPLTQRQGGYNMDAYKKLADRIVKPQGVIGGPMMAEALVLGFQRFIEEGGETGKRLAVERAGSVLPGLAPQALLLIELLESNFGMQQREIVVERLRSLLSSADSMVQLAPLSLPPRERMQRITSLHTRLEEAPLPDAERQILCDRLDAMVASFVIEGKLVEKLDDPNLSLRDRAVRLVQTCASGVLTRPKALEIFRERVIAHLRQPQFDEKFVADIEDVGKRQEALRSFHALLHKAGFN